MDGQNQCFNLPDGKLEILNSSRVYYQTSKKLPGLLKSAIESRLTELQGYLVDRLERPSSYFSEQDFEYLEGSSEEPLNEFFNQIPRALGEYLLREEVLVDYLGGEERMGKAFARKFPFSVYGKRCKNDVILPVMKLVEKYVSSLDFDAGCASRKVHDIQNGEHGIIGTLMVVSKVNHVKSGFCEKCDKKFIECCSKAVSLVIQNLPQCVEPLMLYALNEVIGHVSGEMTIVEYRKSIHNIIERDMDPEELRNALSILPFDPLVIRKALSVYGDNNTGISTIAEEFGIDAEDEKHVILEEITQRVTGADERKCLDVRVEFNRQVLRLVLKDEKACDVGRNRIDERIRELDVQFRTVGKVLLPTRLEAAMMRNDIKFLSGLIGEDVSKCGDLIKRKGFSSLGAAMKFTSHAKGKDIVAEGEELLNQISSRIPKSPMLRLVERAVIHVRDCQFLAGNTRFTSVELARQARNERRQELLDLFHDQADSVSSFRLDALTYGKLKIKGIGQMFSKNKTNPVDEYLVERFLGEDVPKDVRSLEEVIRWQLGFDFFDPNEESFVEISEEGLPVGAVSLENCQDVGHSQEIFSDELVEKQPLAFKTRPYFRRSVSEESFD